MLDQVEGDMHGENAQDVPTGLCEQGLHGAVVEDAECAHLCKSLILNV